MPPPTTAVLFSATEPAPPPGLQNTVPQSDGAQPAQKVSEYMPVATAALAGAVRPDGTTLAVDANGVMSVIAAGTGGGSGTGSGGGFGPPVVPAGAKDGSNTQYTIPSTVLAGTGYQYVTNGVVERQLGTDATFAVQGTQITRKYPLQSDDWHEFYYTQGTPSSETGGGGSVTPVTAASIRGTSTGAGHTGGSSVAVVFPSGTQAGDLVVICYNNDYAITVPSGWTNNNSAVYSTWYGSVISKVMTSGDIATGSVTVIAGGNEDWAYIATAFIGATGGIRETHAIDYAAGHTDTITTSGAVASTDFALYFGSLRGSPGDTISISRGVAQAAVTGTVSQSNLSTEALTAAGAYSVDLTYSGGGAGTYSAVIIVKAF